VSPSRTPGEIRLPNFAADPEGARELAEVALGFLPLGSFQDLAVGLMILAANAHQMDMAKQVPLTQDEAEALNRVFAVCLEEAGQVIAESRANQPGLKGLN
jgi:hypothetical protein